MSCYTCRRDMGCDMAGHSISEAARLTGKARSTLHRHLKNGKLSKSTGGDGEPVIDTAELIRVYGPLQQQRHADDVAIGQRETPEKDTLDRALRAEVEALRQEKLERLEAELEELREQRDAWKTQAERLSRALSDQRESVPSPGSFWRRLIGR